MPRILHEDGTLEVVGKVLSREDIKAANVDLINSAPITEAAKESLIANLACGVVLTEVPVSTPTATTKP